MKKKLAVIIVLYCVTQNSFSQGAAFPFPVPHSQWFTSMPYCHEDPSFVYYFACQDTLIDGFTYNQVTKQDGSGFNPKPYGWLRREGDKVYFRESLNSMESLLYNFALQEGDTAHLVRKVKINNGLPLLTNLFFKVKKVDSLLVKGEWRKRWFFTCPDPPFCEENWIEGIGSNFGPIDRIICYENGPNIFRLNCMVINQTMIYNDPIVGPCSYSLNSGCPVLTTLTEPLDPTVFIYPNPFSKSTTVRFSDGSSTLANASLVDILGNLVKVSSQKTDNAIHLDCANIPRGFYFLKVVYEDKVKKPLIFKVLAE